MSVFTNSAARIRGAVAPPDSGASSIRTIVVIISAVLMLAGVPRAAETPEDAAQKAAESWLKLMDQGKYEESWDAASTIFSALSREPSCDQAISATTKAGWPSPMTCLPTWISIFLPFQG